MLIFMLISLHLFSSSFTGINSYPLTYTYPSYTNFYSYPYYLYPQTTTYPTYYNYNPYYYYTYGNTYSQYSSVASPFGVDQYGNTYIGTPKNGIFITCNGRGCPGRG
uniref:Uncharacterized protein n=1 Tax=Heterorhabditis bacteriophora TaxID=37862 RepID=A0A1I7X3T6_HETBA